MRTRAILSAVAGALCVVLWGSGCPSGQRGQVEPPPSDTAIASDKDAPSPGKDAPLPDKDTSSLDKETPLPDVESKGQTPPATGKDATGGNPQESIETATVQVGEPYEVCLRENRTTAFKWEYHIEPPGGAAVLSDEYLPDPNPHKAMGTGGTHVWAFHLSKPGQVTITFELGADGKDILKRKTCVLTAGE